MNTYTAYCKDQDGFIEEIDVEASNMREAKEKVLKEIEEDYCNSLKIVKIVEQIGCFW